MLGSVKVVDCCARVGWGGRVRLKGFGRGRCGWVARVRSGRLELAAG